MGQAARREAAVQKTGFSCLDVLGTRDCLALDLPCSPLSKEVQKTLDKESLKKHSLMYKLYQNNGPTLFTI
ncbi:hypothetical protein V1477_000948 [Vespula maculifrons]|uniref:Uncharacterized protein n=2 Tax=Vespula TaxID=7451 RepID=A0A834JD13_VESGE|nr:hypothetical protein HZH68_013851 [Vespula germanica]